MDHQQKLVFVNLQGKVVRTFLWSGLDSALILRSDTGRLEIIPESLIDDVEFQYLRLNALSESDLKNGGQIIVPGFGVIRHFDQQDEVLLNEQTEVENQRTWWSSLGVVTAGAAIVMSGLLSMEIAEEALQQELREHVVKIVKVKPQRVVSVPQGKVFDSRKSTQKITPKNTKSVKRMGALAVLGSLKKGKQVGGVNLGQVKVTAGPGLGGTQGSGGVQTSLYGKGIVAAPVGVGGNVKGAGGYGTKGKGGGKAGFGQLSLIGSSGTDSIPLGKEAIINGGLDKDLIARVIRKNMGQVRFCYEQGLQLDPKLTGRVAVDFTIGGNGRVKIAGVNNSTLNSKTVEDCILLRLKSWKFPMPEGGLDVKVSYPFMLKRHGQG